VNPPIGAIKDRWIGGFGGKGKVSNVNYKLRHQSWLIWKWGFTPHDQRLLQTQQKTCFKSFLIAPWKMTFSVLRLLGPFAMRWPLCKT